MTQALGWVGRQNTAHISLGYIEYYTDVHHSFRVHVLNMDRCGCFAWFEIKPESRYHLNNNTAIAFACVLSLQEQQQAVGI